MAEEYENIKETAAQVISPFAYL